MMQFKESEQVVEGWESKHSNTIYRLEYDLRPEDDPRCDGETVHMIQNFCCPEARRSAKRELEFRRDAVDLRLERDILKAELNAAQAAVSSHLESIHQLKMRLMVKAK